MSAKALVYTFIVPFSSILRDDYGFLFLLIKHNQKKPDEWIENHLGEKIKTRTIAVHGRKSNETVRLADETEGKE